MTRWVWWLLAYASLGIGIVGIFAPWLWLVGAFLPAKKGSRYELAQQSAGQQVELSAQ